MSRLQPLAIAVLSQSLVIAVLIAAVLIGGAASAALAVSEINVAPGRTLQGPGIAIHGYDAVAFFTQGKPVIGSAEFSTVHDGATYRFNNAEHLKMFEANPVTYVPAFGGFCAFGVSVGAKFDGDPRYWRIVDGKLYLNLNEAIQKTWLEDVPGNIVKAKDSWTRIKDKDPAALS